MIQQKWGRIIHFSSSGAIKGDIGTGAYSASKSGLVGLSSVICKEYAKFNITSNCLKLGYFESKLFRNIKKKIRSRLIKEIPSGKLGVHKDLLNIIHSISETNYINGAEINIDGGIY